jgi:hypothetical protein
MNAPAVAAAIQRLPSFQLKNSGAKYRYDITAESKLNAFVNFTCSRFYISAWKFV